MEIVHLHYRHAVDFGAFSTLAAGRIGTRPGKLANMPGIPGTMSFSGGLRV